MKNSLIDSAFKLVLAPAIVVISTNAYSDSTASSANVAAPVSSTILASSTTIFLSSVTGDLILRLPGGASA